MSESNSCPYPKCGCLGYGYVPVQELSCIYDCDYAIKNGTIFPELDYPFTMGGVRNDAWS